MPEKTSRADTVVLSGVYYDTLIEWIDTTTYRYGTSDMLTSRTITEILLPLLQRLARKKELADFTKKTSEYNNIDICQKIVAIYLMWVSETSDNLNTYVNTSIQNTLRRLTIVDDEAAVCLDITAKNFDYVVAELEGDDSPMTYAMLTVYFTFLIEAGNKNKKALLAKIYAYIGNHQSVTSDTLSTLKDYTHVIISRTELNNIYAAFELMNHNGESGWHPTAEEFSVYIDTQYAALCNQRKLAITNHNTEQEKQIIAEMKELAIYVMWLTEIDESPDDEFLGLAQSFLRRRVIVA